ncbi:MAG: acyl-CoA dehydrogenase [Proteobacteria bacterium]|nr:acyl-CoA dehydrogenase [Pseudomonadota bacterium]
MRAIRTTAVEQGGDFVINGTKHFISHADHADFVILFAATGTTHDARGSRATLTAFLVDMGQPGFTVRDGYSNVSHRGYNNCILEFDECRVPRSAVLGEVHQGFDVANTRSAPRGSRWGRRASVVPRGARPLTGAVDRVQFGQPIGALPWSESSRPTWLSESRAAELAALDAAWKRPGTATDCAAAAARRLIPKARRGTSPR